VSKSTGKDNGYFTVANAPTYSTFLTLTYNYILESSSKGSSFPANHLTPVLVTVGSLDSK